MNPSAGNWLRTDIRNCCCPEKSYNHVHCPCNRCNGKAIPRTTELRHWRLQQKISREINTIDINRQAMNIQINETEESEQSSEDEALDDLEDIMPDIDNDMGDKDDNASDSFDIKKVVIEAILEAMQLIENTKGSIKNFEEILSFGLFL